LPYQVIDACDSHSNILHATMNVLTGGRYVKHGVVMRYCRSRLQPLVLLNEGYCNRHRYLSTTETTNNNDPTNTTNGNSFPLLIWLGTNTTSSTVSAADAKYKLLLPVTRASIATVSYDIKNDNTDIDEAAETVLTIINQHYESISFDDIGGMGENDQGVYFATTIGTDKDILEYSELLQTSIQLVKQERHGVKFGVYTSGRISNVNELKIPIQEIGLKRVNVSLYGSNPSEYQTTTGISTIQEARTAFGQVCSFISDVNEVTQNPMIHVSIIEKYSKSARDLAHSLGAIDVHVYSD
jgi:hypothetical protein